MGTTLTNGIYLPNEGEKNCYAGLKTNWETLDQKIADITALQQAVAGALHREIVASLPTTDIDPNTIYMVLSGTSATENMYNEFMYVNNAWELIGTSATDLTNYYTKAEVDGKLLLKANASDLTSHTGDTTIHVTTANKNKWNTVTSKANDSECVKNVVTNNQTIKSTAITRGTAPSSTQTFGIPFSDNNNKYIGNIYGLFATDMSIYVGLYAYKGSTTVNSDNVSVRVGYDASGNAYTYAPTPATADNSTQIATTAFVKAQGYLTSHQSLANYVTTNTDQDITGDKNFKGLLTTIPDGTIWPVTANTTDDITYLGANAIHVEQKGSGKLTDLSGGAWSVAELGLGCFFFRINNGADIRYKNFAQNTVNRIPVVSGANRFINDVTPDQDNTYDLGSSSLRWSTINGLNPSALGMPDLSNGIDISSYLDTSQSSKNYYTPSVNGWISIKGRSSSNTNGIVIMQGDFCQMGQSVVDFDTTNRVSFCMLPVMKNVQVEIWLKSVSLLDSAKFFPCQGNV